MNAYNSMKITIWHTHTRPYMFQASLAHHQEAQLYKTDGPVRPEPSISQCIVML